MSLHPGDPAPDAHTEMPEIGEPVTDAPAPMPTVKEIAPDQVLPGRAVPTWRKIFNWFGTHPFKTEGLGMVIVTPINFVIWAGLAGAGLWLLLRKK